MPASLSWIVALIAVATATVAAQPTPALVDRVLDAVQVERRLAVPLRIASDVDSGEFVPFLDSALADGRRAAAARLAEVPPESLREALHRFERPGYAFALRVVEGVAAQNGVSLASEDLAGAPEDLILRFIAGYRVTNLPEAMIRSVGRASEGVDVRNLPEPDWFEGTAAQISLLARIGTIGALARAPADSVRLAVEAVEHEAVRNVEAIVFDAMEAAAAEAMRRLLREIQAAEARYREREAATPTVADLEIAPPVASPPPAPPPPVAAPPPTRSPPTFRPPPPLPADVYAGDQVEAPELVGGLDQLLRRVGYPELALRERIEGDVRVRVVVDEHGEVESTWPLASPHTIFVADTLIVIETSRFRPGRHDGRPVRVAMELTVPFRLPDGGR